MSQPMHVTAAANVGFPPPGRFIETIRRHRTPSGQVRELRKIVETVCDSHGVYTTYESLEVVPPLDCSCLPESIHDVAECSRCLSIVCQTKHATTCTACGRVHCSGCMTTITVEDEEISVCRDCEKKLNHPFLSRVMNLLWG